jgi:hypothetical protein
VHALRLQRLDLAANVGEAALELEQHVDVLRVTHVATDALLRRRQVPDARLQVDDLATDLGRVRTLRDELAQLLQSDDRLVPVPGRDAVRDARNLPVRAAGLLRGPDVAAEAGDRGMRLDERLVEVLDLQLDAARAHDLRLVDGHGRRVAAAAAVARVVAAAAAVAATAFLVAGSRGRAGGRRGTARPLGSKSFSRPSTSNTRRGCARAARTYDGNE